MAANHDVALVEGHPQAGSGLPRHQAVMILEIDRGNWPHRGFPTLAVNIGTSGDLPAIGSFSMS